MAEMAKPLPEPASRSPLSRNTAHPKWMADCRLYRPTIAYATTHHSWRNAVLPSCRNSRAAIWHTKNNLAVERLRVPIGPNAVIGAISPRVVEPFYREIVTVTSHLRPLREGGELMPFLANRDSTSAIVGMVSTAAAKHVFPNAVKAGAAAAVLRPSRSSFCKICKPVVVDTATTRERLALPQVSPKHRSFLTTFASAMPKRPAISGVAVLLEHEPSTDVRTSHVYQARVLSHA